MSLVVFASLTEPCSEGRMAACSTAEQLHGALTPVPLADVWHSSKQSWVWLICLRQVPQLQAERRFLSASVPKTVAAASPACSIVYGTDEVKHNSLCLVHICNVRECVTSPRQIPRQTSCNMMPSACRNPDSDAGLIADD